MPKLIEIKSSQEPGYHPLINFESWRVAVSNYGNKDDHPHIDTMGIHDETDEVFVLLTGKCVLFVAQSLSPDALIEVHPMEPGIVYNVKKGVWHARALGPNASVLIVENSNTGKENSRTMALSPQQMTYIREQGTSFLG